MSRLQKVRVSGLVSILATFLELVLDGYRSWSEMNRVQNGSLISDIMGGFHPLDMPVSRVLKLAPLFLLILILLMKKLTLVMSENMPREIRPRT